MGSLPDTRDLVEKHYAVARVQVSRIVVPGLSHHVTQRDNRRHRCDALPEVSLGYSTTNLFLSGTDDVFELSLAGGFGWRQRFAGMRDHFPELWEVQIPLAQDISGSSAPGQGLMTEN